MKLMATMLLAVFVVMGAMSAAFADCSGHTKAQLVQNDGQQMSSEQQANNATSTVAPAKVAQQPKTAKAVEKK